MNILFIGGGNMASAMLGGLLQQGQSASSLYVVEPTAERRTQLQAEFGIHTLALDDPLPAVDLAVLAVKPQQLADVARQHAAALAGKLVLSIAAGIRMADLDRWLGGQSRLIRVMPNTPALVRAGISGAWLGPRATSDDQTHADQLLRAIGQVVWVAEEAQIDAITAISGSGPAYVFYLLEALTAAASERGFDAATARQLAYATFSGALQLAQGSSDDAGTLREKVTSKGGTTAAALAVLAERQVAQAIIDASAAAEQRAAELAQQLGNG